MDKVKINQLIAENVMDWSKEKIEWIKEHGTFQKYTDNIQDAFKVAEKLKEQYIFLTLTNGEDSYVAEFTKNDINIPDKYYTCVAEAKTVSMAVCLAALKIVGCDS
jgi:hypothetical protein